MTALTYAMRALLRRPTYTASIVLLVAISVGSSTAVFGVLDATVLQAMPYPDSRALLSVQCGPATSAVPASCPVYVAHALNSRVASIDSGAFSSFGPTSLSTDKGTALLPTRKVSSAFFSTLGLRPLAGRWFLPSDESSPDDVVVLSYASWQTRFGGKIDAIGRTLFLDDRPYTLVGVMPNNFIYPNSTVGGWVLDRVTVARLEAVTLFDSEIIVRLAPDHRVEQFQADLQNLSAALMAEQPRYKQLLVRAEPLERVVLGNDAQVVWLLFFGTHVLAVAVAVSLIGALSARSRAASAERRVKLVIGASPARLRFDSILEGLLLLPVGFGLGVALAAAGLGIFQSWGAMDLARSELASIDTRALLYSLLLSTMILFLSACLGHITPSRDGNPSIQLRRSQYQLVWSRIVTHGTFFVNVFVSIVLISAAVSGAHLLVRMSRPAIGFDTRGLYVAALRASESSGPMSLAQEAEFLAVVRDRASADGVALTSVSPFLGSMSVPSVPVVSTRAEGEWESGPSAEIRAVSRNYFDVMGIPLLSGQGFLHSGGKETSCAAVVNRSFAEALRSSGGVVGRVLAANQRRDAAATRCAIVGVVGDVRDRRVKEPPKATVYFSTVQSEEAPKAIVLRSTGRESADRLQARLSEPIAGLTVRSIVSIDTIVANHTRRDRLFSLVLLFFSTIGLCIAAVGTIVAIFCALQATRYEMAVRYAMGSTTAAFARRLAKHHALVILGAALASAVVVHKGQPVMVSVAPVVPALTSHEIGLIGGLVVVCIVAGLCVPVLLTRVDTVASRLRER